MVILMKLFLFILYVILMVAFITLITFFCCKIFFKIFEILCKIFCKSFEKCDFPEPYKKEQTIGKEAEDLLLEKVAQLDFINKQLEKEIKKLNQYLESKNQTDSRKE